MIHDRMGMALKVSEWGVGCYLRKCVVAQICLLEL